MKKLILVASLFALGANVFAQENGEGNKVESTNGVELNGKWMLMGQAGYTSTNEGDTQTYTALPSIGKFITNDVAVGAAFGYTGSRDEKSPEFIHKTNTYLVQPFVRKYWDIAGGLKVFGQASVPVGIGNYKDKIDGVDYRHSYTTYGVEVAPGLDYFFSSNWSVEATFGLFAWNAVNPKQGDTNNTFKFGLNSGMMDGVKVGIKYLF
ncbi:MAG TPA: hypothetical protein VIG94_04560 [Faecalibacter sp.]